MRLGEPLEFSQSADLPYGPEQVFDLVADVERYPEFLKEYRAVRILSRSGDTWQVDQVVGFLAIEFTLSAVATLVRPECIVVRSHQHLMGDLEIRWNFKPSSLGTRVDFGMRLLPASRFSAGLIGSLLTRSVEQTLLAFTERAQHVYGRQGQSH
jgi:coenzyme Q-binding protein COQ10